MWRKKFWYWVVFIIAIIFLLVLYFIFFAPTAQSLEAQPLQYTSPATYQSVDSQLIKDLGYKGQTVALYKKDGNFYDFSLNPSDNSGGGLDLIAYLNQDGHFEKVWQGQGAPDCYSIVKYGVSVGIAPWCDETVELDRSNSVRGFFSLF